jgi:acetylornithine/N-succinyldiaminopimelate aminotransferase
LACAVGAKVVELITEDGFLDEVGRKAGLMRQRIEGLVAAHPEVFEAVRGSGLMLGLVCKKPVGDVVSAGYAAEVLTVPAAENTLRILPPLNLTDEDIAEAVRRLDAAATALEEQAQ